MFKNKNSKNMPKIVFMVIILSFVGIIYNSVSIVQSGNWVNDQYTGTQYMNDAVIMNSMTVGGVTGLVEKTRSMI